MIKIINTPSLYSSLYDAVEFCRKNLNEEINIIVPDKLALFMEKFLFEQLNIGASFNIKVNTLNRFAKRKCVVEKDKTISEVGCVLLIHKILNQNINKLSVLKSKAYSFSYAENILKTINQFKASKITYLEMENFSSKNIQLQNKILDLAFVYKEYENAKAGLLDSSDLFLMSTMFINEGLERSNILFVGFDDFTAIEYSIIEQLALKNNVYINVNYNNKGNKNIFNNEIYSQLKNIAYINEIEFKTEQSTLQYSNLKNFLHNNLFDVNTNKFVLEKETVKVFAGNDISEEIGYVARDIRNQVLEGKNFCNFGVAVYDVDNKINLIKEIFNKYEINYYIDNNLSLNKSIFYKFLYSLIKYNIESYNLCHLIDVISSPFFKFDSSLKEQLIDKLISINFKGKVQIGFCLSEELKDICDTLVGFLNLFNFNSKTNVENCIDIIKLGLDKINAEEILNELSLLIGVEEKILINKSRECVYNLFDEILKFNKNLSVVEFLDIFLHVSSIVKINNLPLTLDAVKIVDANNTMEIFNNLYLVNCTTDTAPSLKYDCGIILDSEIEQLNFKHKLSPTIAHINNLSRLRLFNVSLLFEQNLTVTYSQKPSDLIKEFLTKIQILTKKGLLNIVPIVGFDYSKYVALSNNDYIEFLCKNNKNNLKINQNIIKNKDFNKISNKNLNIFDNLTEISASFLESYFNCPFNCFLQNTLKISKREVIDILPFDVGNILHEIMFKYYKLNKNVADIYEFCRDEIYAFANKNERLKNNLTSPVLTALIDEAVRVVVAVDYIDKNSTFVPTMFEYEFKAEKALKLKNINIRGKVDRVDISSDLMRVLDYKSGKADANLKELYYGNKLQLFLYASAMENLTGKRLVGSFYLPLRNAYSTTTENQYAFNGFFLNEDFVLQAMDKRFEVGYKSDIILTNMNKEGKAGRTKGVTKLESGEIEMLKNYAKKVSEQAVQEIKNGYISPSPSGCKNPCGYCAYAHVCLKNSADRRIRQTKTVEISSFKEDEDV